jgi:hypothetical protein
METRERRIGGVVYRLTLFGTKQGTAMLVRLVKQLGPGAGSFILGVGRPQRAEGETAVAAALAQGVGEALHEVALRLNDAEIAAMLEEFARMTIVVKSADTELPLIDIYDEHFAGHYDQLLQWARWCLEVNFSSFFGASGGSSVLSKLWKMLSALPSPLTSTGPSTGSPAPSATPQA